MTTLAAVLAKAISVSTLLVTVPLTLHYLGAERYGMWATMSSFIALLTFADFGIGNGLLNSIAGAYGRDDQGAIRGYVSSAFFVLTLIALALGLVFVGLYGWVSWPDLFNVNGALARQEAAAAIAVLAFCVALNLPLGIAQRVQMGLQQGFMASLWNGLASLIALVAVLIAIRLQAGLPWLVLAFMGSPLVVSFLNTTIFFCMQRPEIAPRFSEISKKGILALTRTGLMFVALQTTAAVAYGSDNIIVAHTLGAARVAEYSVPAQMFTLVTTVLIMALSPLWPAYGEALSRQDHAWVRKTLARSVATAMGFGAIASLVLLIAAPAILHLWVGRAVQPPFLLLLGLGLWRVIDAGGNAVTVYLNGANLLRFELTVLALAGCAGIALKIWLIGTMGVAGVPWGSILSYAAAAVPTVVFLRRRLAR